MLVAGGNRFEHHRNEVVATFLDAWLRLSGLAGAGVVKSIF